jgi:aldose 1-epimerase
VDSIPVSGAQHRIRAGGYEAVVASVGASLRLLEYEGRDLVVPFAADELRPSYRGATLAPWPNRVVDGRYALGGCQLQLPITEPDRSHALHGLVAWLAFEAVDVQQSTVRLTATIEPQAGYPWRVLVETAYVLDERGLTQRVCATNLGSGEAPWGTGPHPYLVAGAGPLDEWSLEVPAQQVLRVTDDRLAPLGLIDVGGEWAGRFDFRSARPIGPVTIDHAYTDLVRSADGLVAVRLTDLSGQGVAISWDSACPWVQVHTADLPGGPARPGHRAGLAVEPMTCAPDAFNAAFYEYDTGLLVLVPGQSAIAAWTIAAIPAP